MNNHTLPKPMHSIPMVLAPPPFLFSLYLWPHWGFPVINKEKMAGKEESRWLLQHNRLRDSGDVRAVHPGCPLHVERHVT